MAQTLQDAIRSWLGGVVTAGVPPHQKLGIGTSPHALNSMLVGIVQGQTASVAKRPALQTVNAANDTFASGEAILGQFGYRLVSGGVFTRYHVYVADAGRIGAIASDPGAGGANTAIAAGIFTGGTLPEFVTAKNLCFVVNAAARRKLRGTTVENYGITRPASAPTLAVGAAGVMTGTFQVRVTFYNANTGHESSASDTSSSQTLTATQLSMTNIAVSADAQTTARRIYIRDITTQTEFRLAATINDNTSTSTTLNLNVSTLIIIGPNTTENDPPVSAIKHIAWVNSRMFAADDSLLYYSKKNKPEAFDSTFSGEPIGAEDGQKIVGLFGYSENLLIFKTRSVYVLSGTTPESWRIKPILTELGAVSRQSIVEVNGTLYWWSHRGPVRWDGTGPPTLIAELLLGAGLTWNQAQQGNIQAAVHDVDQLVMWTYPESGQTRNTAILPFSYQANAFVSSKWDPMHLASLVSIESDQGIRYVYGGNYNGQFFRFSTSYTSDGVPGGTTTGTFVAAGVATTSITDAGFYTVNQGLIERMVTVEDSNGQLVGRERISANTSTTLTLANAITTVNGQTYTYYVGGPNFEWDTVDHDSVVPFRKKRYEFLSVAVAATGAVVGVDFFTDVNPNVPKRSFSFTAASSGSYLSKVFRAGAVGMTWRARIRNRAAGTTIRLDEVAMQAELLTGKLG